MNRELPGNAEKLVAPETHDDIVRKFIGATATLNIQGALFFEGKAYSTEQVHTLEKLLEDVIAATNALASTARGVLAERRSASSEEFKAQVIPLYTARSDMQPAALE
jgi:hypothetical protein